MIEGLKLMMTGEEIRRMLAERIRVHERRTERWKHEAARTPGEQTVEAPLLPEEMCENEAERHEWRAEALAFIRDHVEPNEVYRLGERDLEFAELLPEKPRRIEQEEYEERTAVGFNLERLSKQIGGLTDATYRRCSVGDGE